jgi:curved DNA-binding protein CbpA
MSDLYEVLGVAPTASPEEIKKAYRRLAAISHPDVGGSAPLFRLVQEAHEVLSDPTRRRAYDLKRTGSPVASPAAPPRQPTAEERRREELARAQSAYVLYATRCNDATQRAWSVYPEGGPSWNEYPAYYGTRAEIERQFAREVAAHEWPAHVRQAAEQLVDALAAEAGVFFRCSALPGTERSFAPILDVAESAEATAIAAAARMSSALRPADGS